MPWEELAPGFVTAVLKPILDDLGPIDIEKRSRLVIDPLGRPVDFESRLRVAGLVDAIKVQGQIEGSTLKLSVQSGDVVHKLNHKLPPGALVSDELSPQGAHAAVAGRPVVDRAAVQSVSSLDSPMEILEAVVEREDSIYWDGKTAQEPDDHVSGRCRKRAGRQGDAGPRVGARRRGGAQAGCGYFEDAFAVRPPDRSPG